MTTQNLHTIVSFNQKDFSFPIQHFGSTIGVSKRKNLLTPPKFLDFQLRHPSKGSLVETHSILEAGSVVPPGRRIPTGELWAGNPARFVRSLTDDEILEIPKLAVAINDLSRSHFQEFLPYSTVYLEVEKLNKSLGLPL
ncbi:hypothetical protein MRB53_027520 [Persea americana]|uniref:Uncharacterized protein n=1 Tax=Persea americana TaxID=3435 RepID=A0ACC2LMD9_PERAE|nr:hypothetical protein MRB53_027520 [Persea americana]